jgi:hypothetical protein
LNYGGVVQKKLLKTSLICVVRGDDPRIYENSIFPAYVPEKNKIITPLPKRSILLALI